MRVALDFNWPLKTTWKGYINPYHKLCDACPSCDRTGASPAARRMTDEWYGQQAFDAEAYGSKLISRDHPKIRDLAIRNVCGDQLSNTDEAMDNIHDAMIISQHDYLINREVNRLYTQCFKNHWKHHLSQDDVDALVADNRLWDFTKRPRNQEQVDKLAAQQAAGGSGYWLDEPNGYHPTADEVNEDYLIGMGHDSINSYVCIRARCTREGYPVTCATCDGTGSSWRTIHHDDLAFHTEGLLTSAQIDAIIPDLPGGRISGDMFEKLSEDWVSYDPPVGEGYQLWETTSEGSAISPVFSDMNKLCKYAAVHCSVFGSEHVSAEKWREMLEADMVCHKVENEDGGVSVFI